MISDIDNTEYFTHEGYIYDLLIWIHLEIGLLGDQLSK